MIELPGMRGVGTGRAPSILSKLKTAGSLPMLAKEWQRVYNLSFAGACSYFVGINATIPLHKNKSREGGPPGSITLNKDITRYAQPVKSFIWELRTRDYKLAKQIGGMEAAGRGFDAIAKMVRRAGNEFKNEYPKEGFKAAQRNGKGRIIQKRGRPVVWNKRSVAAFKKQAWKELGKAKSGWMLAGETRRTPAWIKRHGCNAIMHERGDVITVKNPFDYASNTVLQPLVAGQYMRGKTATDRALLPLNRAILQAGFTIEKIQIKLKGRAR